MAELATPMKKSTLDAIGAQFGIPAFRIAGVTVNTSIADKWYLYDDLLNQLWELPYGMEDKYVYSFKGGILNNTHKLKPVSLVHVNRELSYKGTVESGATLYSPNTLVRSEVTGHWYEYSVIFDDYPVHLEPSNIKDDSWVDMGETGLGLAYKGGKGERGVSITGIFWEEVISKNAQTTKTRIKEVSSSAEQVSNVTPTISATNTTITSLPTYTLGRTYETIKVELKDTSNAPYITDTVPYFVKKDGTVDESYAIEIVTTDFEKGQFTYSIKGLKEGTYTPFLKVDNKVLIQAPEFTVRKVSSLKFGG